MKFGATMTGDQLAEIVGMETVTAYEARRTRQHSAYTEEDVAHLVEVEVAAYEFEVYDVGESYANDRGLTLKRNRLSVDSETFYTVM